MNAEGNVTRRRDFEENQKWGASGYRAYGCRAAAERENERLGGVFTVVEAVAVVEALADAPALVQARG